MRSYKKLNVVVKIVFRMFFVIMTMQSFAQTNTSPLPSGTTKIGGHLSAGASNEVWTDATSLFFNYRGNASATHFWNLGGGAGKSIMSLLKNGNVGIGISSPLLKLHIEDGDLGVGDQSNDNWLRLFQLKEDGFGYDFMHNNASVLINEQGTTNEAIILGDVDGTDNRVLFGVCHKQGADWIPKLTLTGLGNLGLGIINPACKLDVAGTIRATEIKVEAQTADFVFEEDYKLRPLNEVEAFVKENKHLPEIPSAKQMKTDGVNVAEMNKLLLQKIEELTLYVIETQKQVVKIKEELSEVKSDNVNLRNKLKNF